MSPDWYLVWERKWVVEGGFVVGQEFGFPVLLKYKGVLNVIIKREH